MATQENSPFVFVGNNMALDFVNTEVARRGRIVSLLSNFQDLVRWLTQAGAMDAEQAEEALRRWAGRPEAEAVLGHALELRSSLRTMAHEVAGGQAVSAAILDRINTVLRQRRGFTRVVRTETEEGFRRIFHLEWQEADDLLVPVAEAAGDLLCQGDLSLVRKCENPKCVLYYYDISKNHARRWCSMSVCGNRAKAAAHYRRVRETAAN